MTGTVLRETLRRNVRGTLYWALGFAAYGWMSMVILPDRSALAQYVSLMQSMPSSMMQVFGLEDASVLASPEGFLGFSYFLYMMVVLVVYAVLMGLNITANDEDSGIMDIVLSLPLPRWRVIAEKFAAYAVLMTVIVLLGHVGLLIGMQLNPFAAGIDPNKLLAGTLNMLPSGWMVLAVTALIATIVRRRGTAAALAGVFVAASYLLDTLGSSANSAAGDALRAVSFFKYYDATHVLATGLVFTSFVGVIVVAGVVLAGAVLMFQRRDIAV
ncbi:MAG: ABC transporter permease subunit [Armatimonadetes bacterium]|nr:ABC transporter permease subunit [Anaerolineae bacterium]